MGEPVKGASGWMIVLYIIAGIFGLQAIALLVSLGISLAGH